MLYLDNTSIVQELYIPRQDYIYNPTGSSGTYDEGYADGYESGYTSGSTDGFDSGYTEGYSSGETHQKGLLSSTTFTENGEYERENGWSAITVSVSGSVLEDKEIVVSEDITVVTPSSGYDGFSAVTVDATEYGQANYDSGFDDGYTDGYSSGSSEGYDSGYTEGYNSGYTSGETDGYNSGYTSGYTSGSTDGFNSGYTSGMTDGFDSGYTSGETHQKSLLVSTAITQNGSYQRENGYSAITVNVPIPNIEANKEFTATTNGDYTIIPSTASTTVNAHLNTWNEYIISIDFNGYPSGYFNVLTIKSDDDNKYINVYYSGNKPYHNSIGWIGDPVFYEYKTSTQLTLHINNANANYGWEKNSGFLDPYDAMSAVTLNVNVPQTGHTDQELQDAYDSGYTIGSGDGYNAGYQSASTEVLDEIESSHTQTLSVSGNGTYQTHLRNGGYPWEIDGYLWDEVVVNVPQSGGSGVKYVEYLETDGGLLAWDTSVRITDINDVVYFDFMPINWGGGQSPVGSWFPFLIDGDGSDNFNTLIRCFLFDTPADGLCFEAFDYAVYKGMKYNGFTADTRNNCIFDKNSLTINESVIQFSASNVFNTRTICINGEFNGEGGPVFKSAMGRYYGFKLIHSGQTISDLRPCLDGNDVPCFYDEVSQTYIYHSGSGTPIAGPIVDESYESGYTDGYNSGYTVGYNSGSTDGENVVIQTFTAATATTNGVYGSSAHPLSSITVNVPTTVNPNIIAERNFSFSNPTINTTNIKEFAFDGANLTGVLTIGSAVTNIYAYAFSDTPITAITFPQTIVGNEYGNMVMAGYGQFTYTNIVTLDVPNYLEFTENVLTSNTTGIFESCTALTTVNWKAYRVPKCTFRYCSSLSAITLVDVEYIDRNAFTICSSLTQINCSSTIAPTITDENAFQGVPSTGTVHYPQGSDYSSWQSNTYLSGWTFIADL